MATATTGNGFAVLKPGSSRLRAWTVPGANRRLTTRTDQLGFLLVWWASWWNDMVERLDGPGSDAVDEAVYAYREQRDNDWWSEHAGAAAVDLNWAKHPQGVPISRTFTATQIRRIRWKIRQLNAIAGGRVLEWGGEWPSHPGSTAKTDGMHTQAVRGRILLLVRILARGKRGKRVLKDNPWVRISGVKAPK